MIKEAAAQSHFRTPSFQINGNACFGYVQLKENTSNNGTETFTNYLLVADLQAKDFNGPVLRVIDESLNRTEHSLTGASVKTEKADGDHFLLCLRDKSQFEFAAGCQKFRDNWVSTLNNTIALAGSNVQHTPIEEGTLGESNLGDQRRNKMNDSLINIAVQRTQLLESATSAIRSEQNIPEGIWLLTLYIVTTPFVLIFWWVNLLVGLMATLFVRLPMRVVSFVVVNLVMMFRFIRDELLARRLRYRIR